MVFLIDYAIPYELEAFALKRISPRIYCCKG